MANVIKLRKGLDVNLKGKAAEQKFSVKAAAQYALVPDDFVGMTPKVVVREGDKVKAGDALFVNKKQTDVKFASPVSGVVQAVVRGDRRKVLRVVVEADKDQQYVLSAQELSDEYGKCKKTRNEIHDMWKILAPHAGW